jgi:hypothetical protein
MKPCMGGLCGRRDQCPHYNTSSDQDPAERLCLPGRDGERLVDVSAVAKRIYRIFEMRSDAVIEGWVS